MFSIFSKFLKPARGRIEAFFDKKLNQVGAVPQKQLLATYQAMRAGGRNLDSPADAGFRCFSQHEEDGLLLYIFAMIGTTNRLCVEMCCGTGRECNTANLIINHRWTGLLVDGDEANVRDARRFFGTHPDTWPWPPSVERAWLTRGNVNRVIEDAGFAGEIDLFSLDVDGNDYWLWEALSVISPRVVILECNCLWGAERAVSIPYADDFVATFTEYGSDYAGASLPAFVALGKKKGYRLVATNAIGTNAIFVRDDIEVPALPTICAEDCFGHPRAVFARKIRLPGVRDRDWVEVPQS